MAREVLTLKQAAEHVHLEVNELRHVAQRGELAAEKRGEEWFFEHRALDEWAQRQLLAASPRERSRQHAVILEENRRAKQGDRRVADLFRAEGVRLDLAAKTRAGAIRDMADLASATGLVYDVEGLFSELKEREEIASTAIGGGAAFLHPRYHDPYLFEESFVAYGRAVRPVYFGAPDGAATRHFFLICSTDHERHLHILARLAVMAHATEFLQLLDEAADTEAALAIIRAAEEGMLR